MPSTLTQFFQTTSNRVAFRDFGLSLCHSLLKRDQLRLFDRALSSPLSKDHLITPCLRLLTEIFSFDGGALASNVFARRDLLYRRLDGILGAVQAGRAVAPNSSPHRAALAFLVANLKYLDAGAKSELITHGKLLYSAIRSLPSENTDIIVNVLNGLEQSVVDDETLSKQIKARCFNSSILSNLAKLYDYSPEGADADSQRRVRDALHQLLLQVCTETKGVLLPQSGWYPTGTTPEVLKPDENVIDLGLDSYSLEDYTDTVPVKNGTISAFIHTLKPGDDILQANLVTSIFTAAPELIGEYFSRKREFPIPAADDPTWRGQFVFLFSVIQLPAPPNCGWHDKAPGVPPPPSVVIESILPRPLGRTTVMKCFHMYEDVMALSFARLLTVTLEKLDSVLRMFQHAQSTSWLWEQASGKIVSLVIERIPSLPEIIAVLQVHNQEDEQVLTAIVECIAMYHKVLPSTTMESKFDIGPTLSKAILRLESGELDEARADLLNEQITHLLQIASLSPATKWFSPSSSDSVSPIVQLLKYCVRWPKSSIATQSLPVLRDVLTSKGILDDRTRSLEALLFSLTLTAKWQPEPATYQFLDNCMMRTMHRPAQYLDQVQQIQCLVSDTKPLSLLACSVAGQWPFVVKNKGKKEIKNLAGWVAKLFSALDAAGENFRVMSSLQEEMPTQTEGHEGSETALEKALTKQRKKPPTLPNPEPTPDAEGLEASELNGTVESPLPPHSADPDVDFAKAFPPPPPIPESLTGLDRWINPDFGYEIQTGRLANLIRCLVSPDLEVRLQAFHTLQTVMHAVEQSTYPEKTQLHLLLGELSETIRTQGLSTMTSTSSPPSIVAELGIQILPVIADPASASYRKASRFLLQFPSWTMTRLLPYWLTTTFLAEPDADDSEVGHRNAQALEIEHLLDLLANCLRTALDADLFRRAHVFTRLFSYYLAPACSKSARRKILHVVLNAARVPSGSDTLITRAAVREWLAVAALVRDHSGHGPTAGKLDGELKTLLRAVEREIANACDKAAIAKWEKERRAFRPLEVEAAN